MKIKELRVSNNLTQVELAKMVGVKRSTITMWENRKNFPTIKNLYKLADIFKCKVDDLL